jgi:phosphoglycolate phosphatase-like HAD superfamily hydrolase/ADP-ribose pyrophosphatase YjhB (NUDIX family)
MFRNLIFDWSGTLVDDMGPVIEATNHVFGIYGLPGMDREQFRLRFRLPYRDFYDEALPGIPLEELEVHFRRGFAASVVPVTILPHAREKLEWCRDHGIRLFVLTSMDTDSFQWQLDDLGLRDFFEATYSGVIDKREKIGELLLSHGLQPRETAFVGDMTHDVETAKHAALTSIAVLTGYTHAGALAEARPDLTVPDLLALRQLMGMTPSRPLPISTVGALIQREDGKLLMIRTHKWGDRWGIPGGKIRRGETAVDALKREIREETALETEGIRFVMVQDCIDSPEFLTMEHFLLLNYVADCRDSGVVLNDEAEDFQWVDFATALELDLNTPTQVLLLEAGKQGLFATNRALS